MVCWFALLWCCCRIVALCLMLLWCYVGLWCLFCYVLVFVGDVDVLCCCVVVLLLFVVLLSCCGIVV